MKKILWFSAGVTSAVACKIAIDRYGKNNVVIYYFSIGTAHPDNARFISECEKWYGVKIIQESNPKYIDQFEVIEKTKYVNGAAGARCTGELKRSLREKIEKTIEYDGQVFGFEYSKNEIDRSKRLPAHVIGIFPLIEMKMSKENCLQILLDNNIDIPKMYTLGYPNNNCIGCVKGGIGYWNKIRIDFPETFNRMALLERKVGRSCLKDKSGKIFLDELEKSRGREVKVLVPECGSFCGDTNEYI